MDDLKDYQLLILLPPPPGGLRFYVCIYLHSQSCTLGEHWINRALTPGQSFNLNKTDLPQCDCVQWTQCRQR